MVTLEQLSPYFKNKKVLVTGHTGFKGAWLVQILQQLEAHIGGYALAPLQAKDLYNQLNISSLLVAEKIEDIRNQTAFLQFITSFQPDYIFHLAAQPLVIESYKQPIYTFEVNAIGTANVLESLKIISKKCVCVCITTDKVYENPEDGVAFVENNALGGYDPYSASKAAAEIIINSYRSSFYNADNYDTHLKSISSVRAGNVIGGGDYSANRIIPDIIKGLQRNQVIEVRNPNATRPWQHVLEPLGAYLLLATKQWDNPKEFAQAYNIGPEMSDVLTVETLVNKALEINGSGQWTRPEQSPTLHEAQNLVLDIHKAKEVLGWKPKWNAQQSIEKTIHWYLDTRDAVTKCNEQINNYFS